jgi:Fur family peroxide stress response transcriptional regulator
VIVCFYGRSGQRLRQKLMKTQTILKANLQAGDPILFHSRANHPILPKYKLRDSLIFVDAEAIKRQLESSGLRCTAQRYAVMAFLMEQNRHPTAVEIFEAVNRTDPRSSRATTYNNLRDLVQAGLVREVAVEGRAARFDAKGLLHHHFICDRCGNVEDIEWYDVPKPATQSMGKRIVRDCELIFRGFCAKCAAKKSAPQGARPAALAR